MTFSLLNPKDDRTTSMMLNGDLEYATSPPPPDEGTPLLSRSLDEEQSPSPHYIGSPLRTRCWSKGGGSGAPMTTTTTTTTTTPMTTIQSALEKASIILPNQAIMENFVHHNPLLDLQHLEVSEAVDYVESALHNYVSPGERTALLTGTNPLFLEKCAVVDLASIFLDRGASKWTPAFRHSGFLLFFARLEQKGFAHWRSHARTVATRILQTVQKQQLDAESPTATTTTTTATANDRSRITQLAEEIIEEHLIEFGIPMEEWVDCLIVCMAKMKGWAGMFHRMEQHPDEAPDGVPVSLCEFSAVLLIMARSAVEYIAINRGSWRGPEQVPLARWLYQIHPVRHNQHLKRIAQGAISNFSRIAVPETDPLQSQSQQQQTQEEKIQQMQEHFEQKVIRAISASETLSESQQHLRQGPPDFQIITCIDDREGSFRRQMECTSSATGIHVETFGVAGFLGLPLLYRSYCQPVPQNLTPDRTGSWYVEEVDDKDHAGEINRYKKRQLWLGRVTAWLETASFSPLGSILILVLSPFFALRIFLMAYAPIVEHFVWGRRWSQWFIPTPVTDVQTDISPEVAAAALAPTFRMTGLGNFVAPVVVVLGHGACSVNNPYFAAYNCGACAGKKSGPSARMWARLANDVQVRAHLHQQHGIVIPDDTYFVAGQHDTTKDTVEYYDVSRIPSRCQPRFETVKSIVSTALGNNALERCHRFFLSDAKSPKEAFHHVLKRATDYGEVRPELNHAGNAGVVVGRRCLTRTSFFDRRLFLASYDPFGDDDKGTLLEQVLVPCMKVCSGINLEYLFSTISADWHGAGTKSPLNVVGNVGMQQGTYGDLRSGLPVQMVDMHTPLRAFFVVDAPFARVQQVLNRHPDLEELVYNHWIRLAARDPQTGQVHRYIKGDFVRTPLTQHGTPNNQQQHLTAVGEWKNAIQPIRERGMKIRQQERMVYLAAVFTSILSFVIPLVLLDTSNMMNPRGIGIAACATALSLPILAFSCRYMHGEWVFPQTAFLSCGLLLGFNYIAMAPSLEDLVEGWCMFGLASAFLIGTYNDRVTVQSNALFAFASYRFADIALLISVAFGGTEAIRASHHRPGLVAAGVIAAAMFKSSQFPLTSLFSRSMEGPTHTSALGYAGLSAHVGLVLLSSTVGVWMPYRTARAVIAMVGAITAVHAGFVSQIHADRKGALAYATSATIGVLYIIMAFGYVQEALWLALGHSCLRVGQVLRAPNQLWHRKNLVDNMGGIRVWPLTVSDRLFELCWSLRRWDTDTNLIHSFDFWTAPFEFLARSCMGHTTNTPRTRTRRLWYLVVGLVFAGFPFTPLSVTLHAWVINLLPREPLYAIVLMLLIYLSSLTAMRFIQMNVL